MNPASLVIAMLVLSAILVDLAMLRELQLRGGVWPQPAGIIAMGLALGELALVAAWITWSRWKWGARVVVALPLVLALSWLAAASVDRRPAPSEAGEFLSVFLVVLLVVWSMLATASRWGDGLELHAPDRPLPKSRLARRQFSLASLLTAMTAVAVLLGLAQLAQFPLNAIAVASFCGAISVASSIVVLSTFRLHPAWAAVVIVTVCPLAGCALALSPVSNEEFIQLPAMMTIHGATIGAAIAALRGVGFRLQPAAQSPATSAATASDSQPLCQECSRGGSAR